MRTQQKVNEDMIGDELGSSLIDLSEGSKRSKFESQKNLIMFNKILTLIKILLNSIRFGCESNFDQKRGLLTMIKNNTR